MKKIIASQIDDGLSTLSLTEDDIYIYEMLGGDTNADPIDPLDISFDSPGSVSLLDWYDALHSNGLLEAPKHNRVKALIKKR